MKVAPLDCRDRTWNTAGCLVLIAFWTVMILMAREYALWKSSLRAYFLLQDDATDRDIAILKDPRFLKAFSLYSVFLIGFVPIALQKLFRRLYVGVAALLFLFIPCAWYGLRIMHVFGKMVDWMAVFRDTPVR